VRLHTLSRYLVLILVGVTTLAVCRKRYERPVVVRTAPPPSVLKGRHGLESWPCTREIRDPCACCVSEVEAADLRTPFSLAYARLEMYGKQILYLHEDGACDYRFEAEDSAGVTVPYRTLFNLSIEEVRLVRKAISKQHIFGLSQRYDTGMADGTIIYIECRLGSRRKHIACNNYFPDAVVAFNDFLFERILAPRKIGACPAATADGPLFTEREWVEFGRDTQTTGVPVTQEKGAEP
jgi:hypothetical protein